MNGLKNIKTKLGQDILLKYYDRRFVIKLLDNQDEVY